MSAHLPWGSTPVTVEMEGEPPRATTLLDFFTDNEFSEDEEDQIVEHAALAIPYTGGGGAQPVWTVTAGCAS